MDEKNVALVTGVSSRIGRAIATLPSGRGFHVFGTMRRPSEANGQLENVGLVQLDVRDEESVRSCVRMVVDRATHIGAFDSNAGYALIGSLEETSIKEDKELFETNFSGVLQMTRVVLPMMRERGARPNCEYWRGGGIPYQGIHALSGTVKKNESVNAGPEPIGCDPRTK